MAIKHFFFYSRAASLYATMSVHYKTLCFSQSQQCLHVTYSRSVDLGFFFYTIQTTERRQSLHLRHYRFHLMNRDTPIRKKITIWAVLCHIKSEVVVNGELVAAVRRSNPFWPSACVWWSCPSHCVGWKTNKQTNICFLRPIRQVDN